MNNEPMLGYLDPTCTNPDKCLVIYLLGARLLVTLNALASGTARSSRRLSVGMGRRTMQDDNRRRTKCSEMGRRGEELIECDADTTSTGFGPRDDIQIPSFRRAILQ